MLKGPLAFSRLLLSWFGDDMHPVAPEVSQSRANTCLTCPQNINRPLFEGLAGQVALLAKRQVQARSKLGLHVDGEESLHVCGVCGCILKLLVHVPDKQVTENLRAEPEAEYPDHCWKKKLKP